MKLKPKAFIRDFHNSSGLGGGRSVLNLILPFVRRLDRRSACGGLGDPGRGQSDAAQRHLPCTDHCAAEPSGGWAKEVEGWTAAI